MSTPIHGHHGLNELPDLVAPIDDAMPYLDADPDSFSEHLLLSRYERNYPYYFGSLARHLRLIEPASLADLIEGAVDEERLTWDERCEVMLADIVLSGWRRTDGVDIYLLVEMSVRIRMDDVERATERAKLLAKLDPPVVPIVAGQRIKVDVADLAAEHGVWCVLGSRVTPPRDA
jgi:hypothetical protein